MSSRVTQRKVNRSEASVPQKGQIREESEVGPDQVRVLPSTQCSHIISHDKNCFVAPHCLVGQL